MLAPPGASAVLELTLPRVEPEKAPPPQSAGPPPAATPAIPSDDAAAAVEEASISVADPSSASPANQVPTGAAPPDQASNEPPPQDRAENTAGPEREEPSLAVDPARAEAPATAPPAAAAHAAGNEPPETFAAAAPAPDAVPPEAALAPATPAASDAASPPPEPDAPARSAAPAKVQAEEAPVADEPASAAPVAPESVNAETAASEAPDEPREPFAVAALAPDEATPEPNSAQVAPAATEPVAPLPEPDGPAVPEAPAVGAAPAGSDTDTVAAGATWLAYARPYDGPADRPRIAVVVAGLGLGRAATAAAIKLPGGITLAFSSHARDLQRWIDLARAAGHEVMLDLPMEPVGYPDIDPGPQALLTSLSSTENVVRLKWHLDRASGYVGVTHNMGSRFTASYDDMRPVLSALKVRGLMFLDARTSANSVAAGLAAAIGLPRAINDRFLDTQASRAAIDRRLREIEHIARTSGYAVAVSHAFPVTLERLGRWAATLDGKTLALAPISALANKQAAR